MSHAHAHLFLKTLALMLCFCTAAYLHCYLTRQSPLRSVYTQRERERVQREHERKRDF